MKKPPITYDSLLSTIKWNITDKIFSWIPRAKLKNRNFSIIGNNCFVGGMYHKYGLKYTTPTIWTYIYSDDYLRMLDNLDWYLSQPLEFTQISKHKISKEFTKITGQIYPIGLLGGDVEIHFMHYTTQQMAKEKWTTRLKRFRRDNLFVVFSDSRDFKEAHLEKFAQLPFEHKIFLSAKPRDCFECTVFVRDYAYEPYIFDVTRNRKYEKYMDLTRWLNGKNEFIKT